MAPLYWSPCIVYGATRYYIPPSISVSDSWGQDVEVLSSPYQNQAFITEVHDNQPVRLSLDPMAPVRQNSTSREVLDWMYEIRNQLRGKTFALYLFSDRGYRKCAMESCDLDIPRTTLVQRSCSIQIVAEEMMTTALQELTFPNGYDVDYPYAHVVGRPLGESSGGGPIPVTVNPYQTPSGFFSGVQASVTPVGEDQSFVVGGGPTSLWTLESVQITGADYTDAIDDTVVTISILPYDGVNPVPEISSRIEPGQKFGTVSGSLSTPIPAGTRIYARVSEAGEHSDVQFTILLKGV